MTVKPRILVADDEPNIRRILQVAFERVGYEPVCVEDGSAALKALSSEAFDCVLTDVTMPGIDGYHLLVELKKAHPGLPVVIMTAYGTIPDAIEAIRNGAFEFVTKPFDLDSLKKIVANALKSERLATGRRGDVRGPESTSPFIAESPAMREVLDLVRQVADSRATVMIGGESGVGKEVVAKALHTLSSRRAQKFVGVSCAALPETLLEAELFGHEKGAFTGAIAAKAGRFELAHGGTLFLDEIGEVPLSVQVKLLRALQEREFERLGASKSTKVDVRVVTATNRDLHEAVAQGTFRQDLLYRLQVVEILIPPLRDRRQDILPLASHFLTKFAARDGAKALSIGADAAASLESYRWPGNVRELENTIERALALAGPSDESVSTRLLPRSLLTAA